MEIAERLTQKVGPLPAWAWAAIPVGGYIVWTYLQSSSVEAATATDGPTDEGTYEEGYPTLPGYENAPYGSPNRPEVEPPRYTNLEWSQQAIAYLISIGVRSDTANRAISAYLYGLPPTLNNEEYRALQRVLLQLGPSPRPGRIPPRPGNRDPRQPSKVPAIKGLKMTASSKTDRVVMSWNRLTGNFSYEWNIAGDGEGWKADKTTRGTRAVESRRGLKANRTFTGRVRAKKGNDVGPWATVTARSK